jgi:DNA-binding transcriptional regulator YiaG
VSPKFFFVSTSSPDTAFDLGLRLRKARHAKILTQAELARMFDVSERTVQGWEAGTAFPQPRHRRLLLAWLGEAAA